MNESGMDFILTLHSHLPWVLHHGRWPHGSDWLCEAAVDTYLPLLETLDALAAAGIPAPVTLGVTPVLANQLAHPSFARELSAFVAQRLEACDESEAAFAASGEEALLPLTGYWRERHRRLMRVYERWNGDLTGALAHHAAAGRVELLSSAATHGFLPLLAREESIELQLAVGCWAPECAYRPRGDWHPDPSAPFIPDRPGLEEHLGAAGYRFFFVDSHLAEAGRPLGLYREKGGRPDGLPLTDEEAEAGPALRSPYRTYRVSPVRGRPSVTAFVRDPSSTRQVWSRHGGFPGDGGYLEFHKIRYPGGLKFWRVTHPEADRTSRGPAPGATPGTCTGCSGAGRTGLTPGASR
jgi:1,4-alpha-glucan branching enzyme